MRLEYKCTCDGCREKIEAVNDENDVKFNMADYVLCPLCFDMLISYFSNLQRESRRDCIS